MKNKTWMIGLGVGLLLPLAGCPGDDTGTTVGDDTTSTGPSNTETTATTMISADETTATTAEPTVGEETLGTGTTDTTGEPPGDCPGTGIGTAAEGDACTANADCASGVCSLYTDVPVNDDAVCIAAAADCSTHVTATVFDFSTREPLEGAEVIVAAAIAAASNPAGAMALVEFDPSDAMGRIEGTSDGPLAAPLGIVALTSLGDYYLTATGVAAPDDAGAYNVANSIHDLWAVPEGDLATWSDELMMDAEIPAENLPLGENGGVVGLVRDAEGLPVAGAEVLSANPDTEAFVRYLQDDGSFGIDRTSDTGIFVIIAPGLAEQFEVSVDGMVVGGGTAGSANGAIFTLIVNAG